VQLQEPGQLIHRTYQLLPGAEIIAHRTMPDRMKHAADPAESQKLQHAADHLLTRTLLRATHPGLLAVAKQLRESFDFDGIELVVTSWISAARRRT
jgi:hypothetical protein